MATLTLELPAQEKQTAFNLRRWAELLADRELAKFEGRVETDRGVRALRSGSARRGGDRVDVDPGRLDAGVIRGGPGRRFRRLRRV